MSPKVSKVSKDRTHVLFLFTCVCGILHKAWNQVDVTYLFIVIELPQTKQGLNVSEARVTGQM